MTGYGRGEASNGEISVLVEMKSVNNRFCDVNTRLPRDYMLLESRVQQAVKGRIQRGRVDVFVRRKALEAGPTMRADTPCEKGVLSDARGHPRCRTRRGRPHQRHPELPRCSEPTRSRCRRIWRMADGIGCARRSIERSHRDACG